MTWLEILTQLVLPPLLGGAGGIVTVWMAWDVEKRRARLTRRAQLVDRWREELIGKLDAASVEDRDDLNFAFMAWPVYASLRPHLGDSTLQKIEGPQTTVYVLGDFPRRNLIEEIGRIERLWKLA
ncbi:hypothetical protein [Mesorhizobium sp. 113-3-9]|uniref:hypothetical protein n=1 Tax=Mesorhizobium sp. 113-3-9 TaxID=2744517 RepID=UPI001926C04E|nr:hypothetical protein [Mesorhizobium sp. 113-3-9]